MARRKLDSVEEAASTAAEKMALLFEAGIARLAEL